MKLVIICYCYWWGSVGILKEIGVSSYTKEVALEKDEKDRLIKKIKELWKKLGKEGVKAFVLPVEEIT